MTSANVYCGVPSLSRRDLPVIAQCFHTPHSMAGRCTLLSFAIYILARSKGGSERFIYVRDPGSSSVVCLCVLVNAATIWLPSDNECSPCQCRQPMGERGASLRGAHTRTHHPPRGTHTHTSLQNYSGLRLELICSSVGI